MKKSIHFCIITTIVLSLENCSGNRQILGSWKDENSVVTYFKNGTFKSHFNNGDERDGKYSVHRDTLTKKYKKGMKVAFQILSLTRDSLVIKDDTGKVIWHSVKMK